jgi:hypothetical protein
MTTKAEFEAMIEQSKYYLRQVDQLKVLAELKSIYDIDDDATNISIGSILNHVFYEIIINGKLFKVDGLFSSGRTRLIAIKILNKLHDLISKDIFSI